MTHVQDAQAVRNGVGDDTANELQTQQSEQVARMGGELTPEQKTEQIINRQDLIVKQLDSSMTVLSEHTIEMIDCLIVRLTNLKSRVDLEKTTAVDRMSKLVHLSGDTLALVKQIESLTTDLERQVAEL